MPYRTDIRPEWIDYNGHLNEAYYVLIFSHATDAIIDWMGMDDAFRRAHQMSIYTLETHICYLAELHLDKNVEVQTRLIDLDTKRMHLFHSLHVVGQDAVCCTGEMLMACIDMRGPKSTPFPQEAQDRLQCLQARDVHLSWPERAGRAVGIKRRG